MEDGKFYRLLGEWCRLQCPPQYPLLKSLSIEQENITCNSPAVVKPSWVLDALKREVNRIIVWEQIREGSDDQHVNGVLVSSSYSKVRMVDVEIIIKMADRNKWLSGTSLNVLLIVTLKESIFHQNSWRILVLGLLIGITSLFSNRRRSFNNQELWRVIFSQQI